MNQDKFQLFKQAYRIGLEEAVKKYPSEYGLEDKSTEQQVQYAEIVTNKMMKYIGEGKHKEVNYDSRGFKNACKSLGIKFSRKNIFLFLEVE